MSIIYKPKGRAREYSELACNLFNGCEHGCVYCYAPACLRKTRDEFHSMISVRNDVLNKIQNDLNRLFPLPDMFTPRVKHKEKVLLCFTCDPYQGSSINGITRDVLKLFRKHNVSFQVLTKGGMKAARDFDLYTDNDAFACTLTFDDDQRSLEFEPKAALPGDRINTLKLAKKQGLKTWVSFEPVLDEDCVYNLFDKTKDFVDFYKVGKCSGNYSTVSNWERFGQNIVAMMEGKNKKYYIKNDLARLMRGGR